MTDTKTFEELKSWRRIGKVVIEEDMYLHFWQNVKNFIPIKIKYDYIDKYYHITGYSPLFTTSFKNSAIKHYYPKFKKVQDEVIFIGFE